VPLARPWPPAQPVGSTGRQQQSISMASNAMPARNLGSSRASVHQLRACCEVRRDWWAPACHCDMTAADQQTISSHHSNQQLTGNAGGEQLVGHGAGATGGALGVGATGREGVASAGDASAVRQAISLGTACRGQGRAGSSGAAAVKPAVMTVLMWHSCARARAVTKAAAKGIAQAWTHRQHRRCSVRWL
jgi:hypothetical protein